MPAVDESSITDPLQLADEKLSSFSLQFEICGRFGFNKKKQPFNPEPASDSISFQKAETQGS